MQVHIVGLCGWDGSSVEKIFLSRSAAEEYEKVLVEDNKKQERLMHLEFVLYDYVALKHLRQKVKSLRDKPSPRGVRINFDEILNRFPQPTKDRSVYEETYINTHEVEE